MPLLQAEEDRDQVRRYYADKAREKELLGEETKVYNSDRYVHPQTHGLGFPESVNPNTVLHSFVRPTFGYLPANVTK